LTVGRRLGVSRVEGRLGRSGRGVRQWGVHRRPSGRRGNRIAGGWARGDAIELTIRLLLGDSLPWSYQTGILVSVVGLVSVSRTWSWHKLWTSFKAPDPASLTVSKPTGVGRGGRDVSAHGDRLSGRNKSAWMVQLGSACEVQDVLRRLWAVDCDAWPDPKWLGLCSPVGARTRFALFTYAVQVFYPLPKDAHLKSLTRLHLEKSFPCDPLSTATASPNLPIEARASPCCLHALLLPCTDQRLAFLQHIICHLYTTVRSKFPVFYQLARVGEPCRLPDLEPLT
jgi:hypothetical protein